MIVAVTGANSGIGKETALALAEQGNDLVLVCRNPAKGKAAQEEIINRTNNPKVDLMLCDFSSQESIRKFGAAFRAKYDKLDVLVNNAGAIFGAYNKTVDGLEQTFAVNHLGYFLVTHELLALLKNGKAKRIVNVASVAHTFVRKLDFDNFQGEKSYSQITNYGLSKLMNVYFTNVLAAKMLREKTGITVNCLHPGTVYTGFGNSGSKFFQTLVKIGGPLLMTAKKGAQTSIYLASSPKVEGITGKYFIRKKIKKTSKLAQNMDYAQRVWGLSKELTGIKTFGELVDNEVV